MYKSLSIILLIVALSFYENNDRIEIIIDWIWALIDWDSEVLIEQK